MYYTAYTYMYYICIIQQNMLESGVTEGGKNTARFPKGMGEGGGVMFEYVIFLHFDLRGINFFKFETLH